MQRYLGIALAASILVLPFAASAQATPQQTEAAQLEAQAEALLAEVQALEAQNGVPTTPATIPATGSTQLSGSCPNITSNLSVGSSGAQVVALQQFLAANPSIYPQGLVTGFYGSLTETAVENFQMKYGVVSTGSPSTTGFGAVGPRTRAAIASACGGAISTTGTSGTSGTAATVPVGGFIQISPASGEAPLSVTIDATINTTNACNSPIYTLDYGDGSTPQQIQLASGACASGSQSFAHLYQNPGVYTLTLSAGDHSTTATVSVTSQ